MGKSKRSIRNFLLDPRFQLKYASVIALTGGLIFAVMAWLFFDKVRENSQLAAIDAAVGAAPARPAPRPAAAPVKIDRQPIRLQAEPIQPAGGAAAAPGVVESPLEGDEAFRKELADQLEREDEPIVWWLGGFLVLLVSLLFLIGILATHRIVGPIYVVDLCVRKIMSGEPVRKRALRRGDEFRDLFQRVNDMGVALAEERRADAQRVERALSDLQARADGLEGEVSAEVLRGWLEETLAPAREVVAEKRSYLADSETT